MKHVKILSSEIDSLSRRVVKFLGLGTRDVQTALEVTPYGIDSNPIKNMVAIYAETGEKGKTVIIGYINKQQLAGVGELRQFSTDAAGELKFYTWLKSDGTYEIGGSEKNLTRFQEMETAFNSLKGTVDNLVNAFNSHVHPTAAAGPPSVPTPVLSLIPASTSTADISGAKINEIKTL